MPNSGTGQTSQSSSLKRKYSSDAEKERDEWKDRFHLKDKELIATKEKLKEKEEKLKTKEEKLVEQNQTIDELKLQLESANGKVERFTSMRSARGAIDLIESQLVPNMKKMDRKYKWQAIINSRDNKFHDIQQRFRNYRYNRSFKNKPAFEIGKIVSELYHQESEKIHQAFVDVKTKKYQGVRILRQNFTPEQRDVLYILCAYLDCSFHHY